MVYTVEMVYTVDWRWMDGSYPLTVKKIVVIAHDGYWEQTPLILFTVPTLLALSL